VSYSLRRGEHTRGGIATTEGRLLRESPTSSRFRGCVLGLPARDVRPARPAPVRPGAGLDAARVDTHGREATKTWAGWGIAYGRSFGGFGIG
jgi:hypothetical protein